MTAKELDEIESGITESINALPKNEQKKVVAQMMRIHCGPIPSPEELEAYKQISPEVLDYILSEAHANGEHLRECEKKELEHNAKYNLIGQKYAFFVTFGSLVICALAIIFLDGLAGNIIAFVFGATGVTPIVTSFITSMLNVKHAEAQKSDNKL